MDTLLIILLLRNNSYFLGAINFIGSIDNVSVKEVGQDWTFGTGWGMGDGIATSRWN